MVTDGTDKEHEADVRILAQLADGRDYVSHLAREIGVSRPLLHMHLQRLEAVGLVVGSLELSEEGKR
jgi:DNA-binding transcriptional ArsR family regulator